MSKLLITLPLRGPAQNLLRQYDAKIMFYTNSVTLCNQWHGAEDKNAYEGGMRLTLALGEVSKAKKQSATIF